MTPVLLPQLHLQANHSPHLKLMSLFVFLIMTTDLAWLFYGISSRGWLIFFIFPEGKWTIVPLQDYEFHLTSVNLQPCQSNNGSKEGNASNSRWLIHEILYVVLIWKSADTNGPLQ